MTWRRQMRAGLLLAAAALAAAGGEYRHPEMSLALWLPDEWSVDIDSISVVGYGPEGEPRLEVRALGPGGEWTEAGRRALARVRNEVKSLEERAGWRPAMAAGGPGHRWDGEGVDRGRRRAVRLMVWRGRGSWLMAAWVVERGGAAKQEWVWRRIEQSIRTTGDER